LSVSWHAGFLQVEEPAAVGRRVNVDSDHIIVGAGDEHVLGCLDNGVALFESHHGVLEEVIRVVQINVDTPGQLTARVLVLLVRGVAGHPDALIRNDNSLSDSNGGLSPLEVEDVVRDISPVLTEVLTVVELLVDTAGLVYELSACGPRGCKGPGALRWVEKELLDALARVEGLDVCTAVLGLPVYSICA